VKAIGHTPVIDRLQRIALAIRFLRLPSMLAALVGLLALFATVLLSRSHAGDILVIPAFLGLAWGLSAYAFITTFQAVPDKADRGWGLFARLKRNLRRAWYGLIALLFLAATLLVVFLTYRMSMVWLREYFA
jgi:energy-coupling factor transporter transmembrane protein EcfT